MLREVCIIGTPRSLRAVVVAVTALLACATVNAQPGAQSGAQPATQPNGQPSEESNGQSRAQAAAARQAARTRSQCSNCHRDKFVALEHNPHGELDTEEWQARTGNDLACANCHGDASAHIRAGGGLSTVFAFREEPAPARNERCLGCHRASHPNFERSPHANAGLVCTNCHSQHGSGTAAPPHALLRPFPDSAGAASGDRLGPISSLCASCHQEVLTEFHFNERHRLREGALECTSCHDPHEPAARQLLGGFKQEQCTDCHTDKRGPFVFEHPASRVEGCTVCHTPHGSPNRHLLAHQRVAELCLSCHAAVPQFHLGFGIAPSRFTLETQCTNCHSSIHGSNFDSHFLE